MSESGPAIQIKDLSKRFARVQAVQNLNLTVPKGSAFGLIGLNGAGKTTLIKMLIGATHPNRGQITILGNHPQDISTRRRMGYLPERLIMPQALSARSFLRSVGRIKGLRGRKLANEIEAKLTMVDLDPQAWGQRTGTYSKGMLQRTGLAAALMGDPELLLLDEPTDGIDPLGRAHLRLVLQKLHQQGTTIFLNSHLLSETEKLCQHVAIMHKGKVVRSGSIQDLRAQKRFKLRFAEHPQMQTIALSLGLELGLELDQEAQSQGAKPAFIFADDDPSALNTCLHKAQQAGLLLIELQPMMLALEDVLAQTLDKPVAA